jgi:predicted nucleic acid-binding protein
MLNTANKVADASRLTAVADASFVIGISLCQQWGTLEVLVENLIISDKVWEEIVERGEGQPGEKELRQATFVERRTVSNTSAVTMLMATLDAGEAETLVLATELDVTKVFVDDLRGRKVAQSLGLQAIGVAGFLLFAKKKGKIREVRPLLLRLLQKGFRLSSRLINAVLEEAGETLL